MAILPKGTQITCPRKRHPVGTFNQDVKTTGALLAITVDFEPGQEVIAGDKMVCKLCNSSFFQQGKIHTSEGWKPNDPLLEQVT